MYTKIYFVYIIRIFKIIGLTWVGLAVPERSRTAKVYLVWGIRSSSYHQSIVRIINSTTYYYAWLYPRTYLTRLLQKYSYYGEFISLVDCNDFRKIICISLFSSFIFYTSIECHLSVCSSERPSSWKVKKGIFDYGLLFQLKSNKKIMKFSFY